MMNSKERAELKARANSLDTILQVGWQGIGDNLVAQVDGALEARELIKLRVLPSSPLTAREAAGQLSAACHAETVQVIGTKIVLYRKKAEKPPAAKPKPKPAFDRKPLRAPHEKAFRRGEPSFSAQRSGERRSGERAGSEFGRFRSGGPVRQSRKFAMGEKPSSFSRKPAAGRRPNSSLAKKTPPAGKSRRGKN